MDLRECLSSRLLPKTEAFCAALIAVTLLGACRSGLPTTSLPRRERATGANIQQKLGQGMKLLMDLMENPGAGFHLSYKAKENINPRYGTAASAKPEIGPVELEADVTPDEVNINETRGTKKTETKAKKSDQLNWSMAKLEVLGTLLEPNVAMAFGGMAARSAGSDTVSGIATDKIEFDTSKTASAQAGLALASGLLGGKAKFDSVKGTAWLDKTTGRLVKFDVDSAVSDKAGNSWQQHHEATFAPK